MGFLLVAYAVTDDAPIDDATNDETRNDRQDIPYGRMHLFSLY
jgi:hypothetical protein